MALKLRLSTQRSMSRMKRRMKKKMSMAKPCAELVERTMRQMNFGSAVTYVRGGSMASV